MRPTPRLVPEDPLPPYSYVPRKGLPHPRSHPAGHSCGRVPERPPAFDPRHWRDSQPYLYGLDLFNHGFFWEAHEAWEGLWHAFGRTGATADVLKGLIKLAAAGVKHAEGVPHGTRTHARRAAVLWREVGQTSGADGHLGLRLGELAALAEGIDRDGWPLSPIILRPGE
jgi:hypothetical protein